jgi:hypothetical protein
MRFEQEQSNELHVAISNPGVTDKRLYATIPAQDTWYDLALHVDVPANGALVATTTIKQHGTDAGASATLDTTVDASATTPVEIRCGLGSANSTAPLRRTSRCGSTT